MWIAGAQLIEPLLLSRGLTLAGIRSGSFSKGLIVIYLLERQSEPEREKERDLLSAGSLPQTAAPLGNVSMGGPHKCNDQRKSKWVEDCVQNETI